MWARRCGARKQYPSRVRVVIQAFVNSLVGWVVFKFLTDADVGYLDLESPAGKRILCLYDWPLRYEGTSWIEQDAWSAWSEMFFDQKAYIEDHECDEDVPWEQRPKGSNKYGCKDVRFPAKDLHRNLGWPIGRDITVTGDAITVGATWFLYLGFCLWYTTTVHDLALTTVKRHDDILDLMGIRKTFPKFMLFTKWMLGYQPFKMMMDSGKAIKILAWVLLPLFIAWGIIGLAFLWWPVAVLVYIIHPVSLSRAAVFINAVMFVLLGLTMTFFGITFIADHDTRPMYSVTWETNVTRGSEICTCGCTYNINMSASSSFTLIGLSVVWKSFVIGFRCLKGLRRSNWANLLTVMFPVPLNIYPVEWTQPDGKPIQHRTEEDPVQGELAFDPFALMDEQPESADTTLFLKPQPQQEVSHSENELHGPVTKKRPSTPGRKVQIGCCGFPYMGHVENESEPEEPVGQSSTSEGTRL